ncbi:hypothetical protein F53441_8469 [Fusarium austroafricanum]|uniref:Uncharacterized protein n=1 Tax=Fusarium austroafricanum TaxID=2364996 RepID=A0A8H4KCU0_9HYPO|nr:hypothetical protein F53441_8469 [Fusarium austroafricanum]
MLGYLVKAIFALTLYGWDNYHPTRAASRHVRALRLSTSKDGEMPYPSTEETSQSYWATWFPTKGLRIWIPKYIVQSIAGFGLRAFVPAYATEFVLKMILAPFQLVWIQAVAFDQPMSFTQSIAFLRSITLRQWMHFLMAFLAFDILSWVIGGFIAIAFVIFIPAQDEETNERPLGTWMALMASSFVVVIMVFSNLQTVATVQAAPDPDEKDNRMSTWEFWARVKKTLKTMPWSLWWRFVIYGCLGLGIGFVYEVIFGTSIKVN